MNIEDLSLVLIETYWNVNYCFWILKYRRLTVLIETYWNVNKLVVLV